MKNLKKNKNHLIISNKKIKDLNKYIFIDQIPINLTKLIESINIRFLKIKFSQQSDINLGKYILNLTLEYFIVEILVWT